MRKNEHGETFGAWLIKQKDRDGAMGELIKAAKLDPKFPKQGDPEDVRRRLREVQAEGDIFDAVEDAELDWTSY